MSNRVLVVAAHSDDEVLGCGGTIAKHTKKGDLVSVAFMTDGVSSRVNTGIDAKSVKNRLDASNNSNNILGVSNVFRFNFPDNEMDSVPLLSIVKAIETVIEEVKPNIVYTHFSGDLNVDHQLTSKAVATACRPQSGHPVKEIYYFEVLSSTEWNQVSSPQFRAQKYVDISEVIDIKSKALGFYEKEMRPSPHSRSYKCVEALASFRGESIGVKFAEAFYVERILS